MNYDDFMELEPGDLVVATRGRNKNIVYAVDYIDEDAEIVKATWSDMNDGFVPNPIPSVVLSRYSVRSYDD